MMAEIGAHILVFPYPAQGHMIPLLDFTHHLATRGLTVTILVTPKNLPLITPLISAHPHSITPLVLPFPPHASIPAGVENTIDLPPGGFRSMMCVLAELRNPIVDWFRNHPSPPVSIVSDMFLGWTHDLACQLSIPRYAFFPSGAFASSFILSCWLEMPQRKNMDDVGETLSFADIPNSPVYPWWQVSPVYRSYVKGDPDSEFIKDSLLGNVTSYGLVFNTFDGLEMVYLEYLAKKLGHNRIWSIGPLLPHQCDGSSGSERGGSSSVLGADICSWLDKCEDGTVVYVCFGSQALLSNNQMRELALGLERSGVKFILAVKGGYGSIPVGFEERVRVAGRGLVIKGWAPQVLILKHRAICAFLTHCGWNSALESIIAGVPMLAWPMGADQFINATLLVDQLDVAIRICEGSETVLDSNDLVKFLGQLMSGETKWKERRSRALTLSKAALAAITEPGGTSFQNLDHLAKALSAL